MSLPQLYYTIIHPPIILPDFNFNGVTELSWCLFPGKKNENRIEIYSKNVAVLDRTRDKTQNAHWINTLHHVNLLEEDTDTLTLCVFVWVCACVCACLHFFAPSLGFCRTSSSPTATSDGDDTSALVVARELLMVCLVATAWAWPKYSNNDWDTHIHTRHLLIGCSQTDFQVCNYWV